MDVAFMLMCSIYVIGTYYFTFPGNAIAFFTFIFKKEEGGSVKSYHLHKVHNSSKMNENNLRLARINMLDGTYNSTLNEKLTQGRGYKKIPIPQLNASSLGCKKNLKSHPYCLYHKHSKK